VFWLPFSIDYKAPQGLFFGFSNIYLDAEDPFGSGSEYALGQTKKRWTDDLKTHLGYGVGDGMKMIGYFNYFKQDYDDDIDFSQDHKDFEFGAGYEYRFLPKTWGFIRYHYGEIDYFSHPSGSGSTEANDADRDWHRINVGLTWDARAKLTGELNFGYQWNNWDNETDLHGLPYDEKDTWIAATTLYYKATQRTTIGLDLSRALRSTGSDSVDYFEDTSLGANLQQAILDKFTVSAGISYQVQDYHLGGREDDNINLDLGVDYKINQWFTAGAGYTYQTKDSSSDWAFDNFGRANEYNDNRFFIEVNAVY